MTKIMNYTIEDIVAQADRAINMNERVRNTSFTPNLDKTPPLFNGNQITALCKIERNTFNRRLAKGDLPGGILSKTGRREFTLAEARVWARAYGRSYVRQDGQEGVAITVANSKGGVGKTTTAMCLAQGLNLLGYRVLVVDLDPQGSLSSLCGYLPDTQVKEWQTVLPFCAGSYNFTGDEDATPVSVTSLDYAIRPTYWDGLDAITSAPSAFAAEFCIPTRALQEEGFKFYEVIKNGIDEIKQKYDVIIFDCPPTMSYLTIGAAWASDGLIIPVPPRGMDFSATAQFWSLFTNLARTIADSPVAKKDKQKEWQFINVLLSMVDGADERTGFMQRLINDTYGSMVVPVEIPKTQVLSGTAADYKTVYDLSKYQGLAKPAYDRVVDLLEQQIRSCWKDS